jgi:hypothetical protein
VEGLVEDRVEDPAEDRSEVKLEEYHSWCRSSGDQGTAEGKDRPAPRDRTPPSHGQKGGQGQKRGRGRQPTRQQQSRLSNGAPQMALMQPVRNQGGMKGLLQPAVQAEGMQRLAVMLALMVLGSPQVYRCHTREDRRC